MSNELNAFLKMENFDELIIEEDRLYDDLRRAYSAIYKHAGVALDEEFFATTPEEHAKKLRSLTDLVTAITHQIERVQNKMMEH